MYACVYVCMWVHSPFGAWMQHCADKNIEVWDDDDDDNEREVKRKEKIEKYK